MYTRQRNETKIKEESSDLRSERMNKGTGWIFHQVTVTATQNCHAMILTSRRNEIMTTFSKREKPKTKNLICTIPDYRCVNKTVTMFCLASNLSPARSLSLLIFCFLRANRCIPPHATHWRYMQLWELRY